MLYIGCRLLWSAWYGEASLAHAATPRSVAGAFRHGVLTNLANPKALALFASLFAVLVPPDAPSWFGVGLLVTVIVTTASWYVLVAITLSSDAVAYGYRRVERSITAVIGAVFVGSARDSRPSRSGLPLGRQPTSLQPVQNARRASFGVARYRSGLRRMAA